MAEQPSDSIDTLDDKSEGEKLDSSEEILRMTDEVDSSLLRLQLPLQSSSSPATPSSEILDDQGGLSDVDGEAKVGENQKRGSQKRNRSAGPRLMILNPASSSNNSNSADREGDSNPRIGSSSSSDCKPRRDFNFQFSSELEKSFPVSGEVEAKIFSGSRKFVKLDSLLSQNKEPMSCPVLSNQMKGFLWKEDGENSDDEEPLPSLEDMEKPEMTRRESFFQLKKENVAQQRLISVDREQCHKKEQAELCMEEVPDMKQQQAVTVCRSNTWSFKNSSEAFEKLRTTSLKRQSSYIETEADRRSLRQRQRQQTPHRQHPVIVERDEEEVGGEEERATMSDDTDDRPCHMRHRSNTVSNVVKSYSIVDRDFRVNQELVMWNRDLSAKMADRSNVGSVDDKSPDATDDSLVQKCVVLQRDQHGYGLTVAGDSPTYVQVVKENGAAARAGIQRGDKILKVNGTLVTHCSHSEVSSLLKFGSYVNLTLLGRLNPGGQVVSLRNLEDLKEKREGSSSPMLSDKETDISNPKKVDASKASHYHMQKVMTMKMMQKQIREELEHMKLEYDNRPSEQLCLRLEAKKQMLDKVQDQLNSLQEAEIMPKRPSSAGHDLSETDSEGSRTQFPAGTPPTTRHKKSDSMPEALYKMSGVKRQSTQSESKVVEALVEERGALGSLEGRSRGGQSSYFGEAGKGVRPCAESPPDVRHSPGTPSTSPYQARSISSMIRKRCLKVVLPSQVKMGTVEDSDFSTLEDPSIFTDLDQLKSHPAHLSVFLHYVMPNFDPAPMLFYIVTESYSQGSSKDLRKWAYEIYSTFLHEKSPLRVNVEDELVSEVEATLSFKQEDEDAMRNVFVPSRNCLTNEILNQLADFRAKRASGLGSIYGDQELRDVMDKNTELRIIENGLWKYFERLSMNKNNDRCKALASALATFFKGVGLSSSKISSSLERCYTFNAKDKKTFRFKTNKKLINGHQYVAQQYFVPTYCHWCHQLFWGIGHQGFQCSHCETNVHKNCIEQMKEPCSGGTLKKRKDKKSSPSVFDKIISRKISANNPLFVKEAQHMHEVLPFASPTFVAGFSTPTIHTTAPLLNGENEETGRKSRLKTKLRPFYRAFSMPSVSDFAPILLFGHKGTIAGLFKSGREHSKNKRSSSQDPHPEQRVKVQESSFEVTPDPLNPSGTTGSSSTSVNRSETVHAKVDSKINIRRAHSMFTTERKVKIKKHIDVTPENQPSQPQLSDSSGCSSNSSLSAKSSEIQGGPQPEGNQNLQTLPSPGINSLLHPLQGQHSFSSFSNQNSQLQQHPFISHSLSSLVVQPLQKHQHLLGSISDSDFEVDSELPSIESHVPKEQLKKLKPKERKRQEVINELFHTEQAHVRNLKVMYRIFYQPMLEEASVPRDLIDLIFPNLKGLIDCHCSLNEEFKAIRKSENVVGDFAHVLVEKFSGEEGENLKSMASTFCQNQSHCLEVLRVRQRKDAKFAAFLQEAASHPLCRRLELKDLIPTEMQRLTKYPLLIENLLKYTQTNTKEYEILLKSLECSKSVLSHVDQRVKECENLQKLSDLQRRLDTKPIENSAHPVLAEYKKLDLRRHKMVYDGPLTWRICKTKQLEMHAVLLEDILVLLQKSQDSEKLVLRCPNSNVSVANTNPLVGGAGATGTIGKDDTKTTHSPIIKLSNILLRNVATDKKAFFLVSISEFGPQIYEFVATTRDEKNRWFRYITEASENYKHLQGITDKSITPSCLKGYMSGNNVVTTGGQEAETVQPSGVLPLLSSSISSIIPDDVAHLKVAKVDPSFHHLKGAQAEQTVLREVRSRSRSRSCESDSDGQEVTSEENIATVMIVESDGPDEGCLVQPNEVKVSTMTVLKKHVAGDEATLLSPNALRDINGELSQVMREKKQIVSSILGIPLEEYDNFAEIAEEEAEHSTDVKELLLALLAQTDHLMSLVNDRIDRAGAVPCSSPPRKLPEVSLRLGRMVTIPSSQILGISTKLNHLLLQLMEVLIQQERNDATTDRVVEESQTEPDSLALHSTNREPLYVQDHAPYVKKPIVTSSPTRLPAYIEKSCIASLKATVVDSPKLETGHVLTTSVNSLFCGAKSETQSSSQIFTAIGSNDDDDLQADDGNDDAHFYVVPPTTVYTSTCQLPRLVESQQAIGRSDEDRGGDEGRSPPPAERALTVL